MNQGTPRLSVITLRNWSILLCSFLFLLNITALNAQQIDLENLGTNIKESKPVKVGGGFSANSIFHDGNDGQGRQPFTWFLNGNINFNLYNQVNLPFTFNFTNLGNNYRYPTLPNRLSVHPTYKWITGHIGDVTMSFSPYTLNGHMFTGVGVDLTPQGPFKISAMAGRLQRKAEYDTANLVPVAYQRFGYGAKVRYDQSDYYVGMSFLSAKDDPSSLNWQPDSLDIYPQGNVAFSLEGGVKLLENLFVSGMYGLSLLTRDVRAPKEDGTFINRTFGIRTSTSSYKAFKFDINYQWFKNTIGIGYERIDPEYKTLGAYFFNNDFENITLKYARPFLKDKVNIALSWGMQRDDLNNTSEQSSKRFVSSANVNYTPHEKFNASLSYSGFQTFMNIRSQFDYINSQTPYDNLDTLNFTQLSQNLSLNVTNNFGTSENRKHNLNANISVQEAADKQGDIIQQGSVARLYNLNVGYSLLLVPQSISLMAAFNTTHNRMAGENFLTLGPMVGVRGKFFNKKITMGLSSSFNESFNEGLAQNKVWNMRGNFLYTFFKRHNLMANTIWQNRNVSIGSDMHSLTATVGYSYSF